MCGILNGQELLENLASLSIGCLVDVVGYNPCVEGEWLLCVGGLLVLGVVSG